MDFLRELYDKEPQDVRNQCLEYDFMVDKSTFDLKADTIMNSSRKFFLETWSVKDRKKGWLYNTKVHWILYLDVNELVLYMLDIERLRLHESDIKKFPYYEITQQSDYVTCGHVVPIFLVSQWLRIQPIDLKPLTKVKV